MVSLDQLKDFMRKKAEEDRQMKSVQVTGDTLEQALKKATIELELPLSKLEYDILQKGSTGVFGYGKKAWSIIAYEVTQQVSDIKDEEFELIPDMQEGLEELEKDVDGQVYVRLYHDGAYLKVTKPLGKGREATEEMAIEGLHKRAVRDINKGAVKGTIKLAMGEYSKVGEFIHNPAADTTMSVDVEDNEMKGILVINPPGPGGADLSREEIIQFLKGNGIHFGIQENMVDRLVDEPKYNERLPISLGAAPNHGDDAKIQYFFDTSLKFKPKEVDGKVDFKSLNTIHNVLQGEDLAKKDPAQKGEPGRTVTGKMIPARDGKDVPFDLGNNVELSRDGLRVTATADGQVLLQKGKISVETVMVIPGDVGVATGDINSFGSVIVKGNVEDGYTVKAAGNVEIMGNVGKSKIETPGDIIVHQGINGNGGGMVHAGQNLWSKFVQNATVEVGAYVVVSDGIIHSQLTSNKKIICKGKRAKIVGGHLVAAEEINAGTLGAVNASETVLEVGFDPKAKEELKTLLDQKEEIEKKYDEIEVNVQGIEKNLRIRKKLTPEKTALYKKLKKDLMIHGEEIKKLDKIIGKKQEYLDSLRHLGKISASVSVFPGVKVIIKDLEYDVTRDFGPITFVQEAGLIKTAKYEDIQDDIEISR